MLAIRSLVRGSQPLLSRLRPVHHHARHPTTVLGENKHAGSRGYASNGVSRAEVINGQKREAATAATKRHLYVVLDDHKDGYGIHKLDLSNDDGQHLDGAPLPNPPVLRVALPTIRERAQFAAMGNNIVGIGSTDIPNQDKYYRYQGEEVGSVLIYDTKTAAVSVTPHLPEGLLRGYQAAMAVGNRLYMIGTSGSNGTVHCLAAADCADDDDGSTIWTPLYSSSPWFWINNESLQALPFRVYYMTAHAVHVPPGAAPHDHDILVSVSSTLSNDGIVRYRQGATFSFNTARGEWTQHGEWQLPVSHAHYDAELDLWLGFHALDREYKNITYRETDGRLCAGNIMSAPEEWKVGREKLFRLDEDIAAGWRHLDANLVHMASGEGCGGEYCLMERLRPEDEEELPSYWDDEKECFLGEKECLLRLTTFRIERGHDGEPVATALRPARSYKVPRYNTRFDAYKVSRYNPKFEAKAFWM